MENLREISLDAYDRLIGLELAHLAVDGYITKAPCGGEKAGRSPVDRAKEASNADKVVDARGIPLGTITAPANRHDSPLLEATLDTLEPLGELPDRASVHLDRAYDSATTRRDLAARWSARSPRRAS
jgi:Transposase DDE domain